MGVENLLCFSENEGFVESSLLGKEGRLNKQGRVFATCAASRAQKLGVQAHTVNA
jgi:hypothetical protein